MGLYRYNKVTGYWKLEREVTPETKDKWLDIFTKDSPKDHFVVSSKKPTKNPMKEEHEIEEARMSVAVRMQRAIERQRAKSDASLRRTPSSIPKKEEPKKQDVAEGSELSEVLSISARRARGMQFRRMQSRIQTAKKRQALRYASPEKLNNRARRAAIRFLKARVSNNKSYASMSPGEKINVDKRVQKMLPSVGRIASRLLPQVRNAELQRKTSQSQAKESIDVNLQFKTLFSEAADKETSRIDQLVRMGLADKKMLSIIKQAVAKLKNGDTLNNNERKATNDLLTTLLDMVTSSDALFRMTKGELQKEDYSYEDDDYSDADSYYDAADKADDATDGLYMAKTQVNAMIDDAEEVLAMLDDMEEEPDAWVLSKVTLAYDYVSTVKDYLEFNSEDDSEDDNSDDEMDDEDMYDAVSGMSEEDFDSRESYRAWNSLFENKNALKQKAEKYGIPFEIISEVYARGIDSWDAEMNDTFTPQQWAFARVNSFVARGNGSWNTADKDLAEKVMINEKFSDSMEFGTDSLRAKYAKDTPGQQDSKPAESYKKNLIKSLVAKKTATQSTEK